MKKKNIKKTLLIALGIIGLLIISASLIIWFAFGPINSTGEFQISKTIKVEFEETYNGDFAGEFYDVKFKHTDSIIGSHTFHNMDWAENFHVDSLSGRTFLFFADSSLNKKELIGYFSISFEPRFQSIIDTVYMEPGGLDYLDKMKEIINKH